MKRVHLGVFALALGFVPQVALLRAGEAVQFIRGDANSDGVLSTADLLTIQRWLFGGDEAPSCIDAADVDDSGRMDICDAFGVMVYLLSVSSCSHDGQPVDYGPAPHAPFPEPGVDPTPDTEPYMSCNGFTISPAVATDDTIRIGDVEASGGGGEVEIPVYVANSVPVEAVQLVMRYDPELVRIASTGLSPITYAGTYYEQFKGIAITYQSEHESSWYIYDSPYTFTHDFAEDGFFAASIIPDILGRGNLQVPAGVETLVAKVRVEVSPDVPAGTAIHLDPMDGLDGQGYGPFHLRNELTSAGEGRYPTILPHGVGGVLKIGVDGDISFFIRGDSNGDANVDVSDAVHTLGFLFLGGDEPRCFDAADADDDGAILITDAIAVLSELFLGEHLIAQPFPAAGLDQNPDFLKKCGKR